MKRRRVWIIHNLKSRLQNEQKVAQYRKTDNKNLREDTFMDILFNNPIANMPGVWFLIFYGVTICLVGVAFWVYKPGLDWTAKLPLPLVAQNPDPFEIAYLRGGENEFVRTVVFSLVQKKFVEITTDGTKNFIKLAPTQPNWTTLSEMERNVLKWCQVTHYTNEIFAPYGLVATLNTYSVQYEAKLVQNKFLTPQDVITKTRFLALSVGLAVALLGCYKIISALMNGRTNVIFAIIMTLIGFFILYKLGKVKRISALGQKYLERVQQAFDNLRVKVRFQNQNELTSYNGADPFLLTVGVFGVGALAGTDFNDFEQTFHRSSSASSGGSCGSSCGTSSCSSGGDAGGSCGGGCGGCGGD